MVREDYLHQNAYHKIDTYTSIEKQSGMLDLILTWFNEANSALDGGVDFKNMENLSVNERNCFYEKMLKKQSLIKNIKN